MEVRRKIRRGAGAGAPFLAVVVTLAGLGAGPVAHGSAPNAGIAVVAAENEYGNVAAQIGGRYVTVDSVESNPNTDPHTYEVSPGVAQAVSSARVVIQNGIGYDDFMTKIESASPNPRRYVVDVQQLLGLPDSTPNPHLWYNPASMPKVADKLAADFSEIDPRHAAYFRANAAAFATSLRPWLQAIARFRSTHPNTPVATTEPVADYMLEAAGTKNLTPFTLQADIMNGVDPSPQDVSIQEGLFSQYKVKVFVYNQQVTDSLTESFIADALHAGIPVVGVYETMPVPGYDYQSWMLAEVAALQKAVADDVSTTRLKP
ncbi:MAG TPA: zinc ABC transporter substrate-binding protein [Acidimicrobiales bacterium]|nr:zinc ABC transporter substrate-binding protein [Acidimicrobiales bacterium]